MAYGDPGSAPSLLPSMIQVGANANDGPNQVSRNVSSGSIFSRAMESFGKVTETIGTAAQQGIGALARYKDAVFAQKIGEKRNQAVLQIIEEGPVAQKARLPGFSDFLASNDGSAQADLRDVVESNTMLSGVTSAVPLLILGGLFWVAYQSVR